MTNGNVSQRLNTDKFVVDNSYGFFLFFFDEIRGHIPLFAYPKELLTNENEKQIISIHSIWWNQDKFLETRKFTTMDVELGNIVYTATLVFCPTHRMKRRPGMNTIKWQDERFVLVVRAPSLVSFIAHEILHVLKTRIEGSIGENLGFLVEKNIRLNEASKIGDFLKKKSKKVEEHLTQLCKSLIPKFPITKLEAQLEKSHREGEDAEILESKLQQHNSEHKMIHFSIPTRKRTEVQEEEKKAVFGLKHEHIKIIRTEHVINEKIIRVIVRNDSPDIIHDVLLKVIESKGFFGKNVYVSSLKNWAPKTDLSIEFKPSNEEGVIYFLKIDDDNEMIIKKIVI
ncbi:MAG: hypothetical protein ACFFB5_08620 [Promethearchaeota archaeon]